MTIKRDQRLFRTEQITKARQSGDPNAGPIEEMQLAREVLDPTDFEQEAHLATKAHFENRYKTPYERTEAFMRAYQKWYAKRQERRHGKVGRWVPKLHLSMCSNRQITCFWRARQHADLLGVPYEQYIISVMLRATDIGAEELPAPNQLYGDDLQVYVAKDLAPKLASGTIPLMPRDCDPRLFAENYRGDPVQIAALDAIEAEVRKAGKSGQASELAWYMRQEGLISEAEARRRLGDELVDEALDERLLNPVRPSQLIDPDTAIVPGCFGHRSTDKDTTCHACPVADACQERRDHVMGLLLDAHGTTDVKAKHNREIDRKRKQRQRDRKRLGKALTLQEEKRLLQELANPKLKEKRLKAKIRRDEKKGKKAGEAPGKPEGTEQGLEQMG
jgi:hypothetical protein